MIACKAVKVTVVILNLPKTSEQCSKSRLRNVSVVLNENDYRIDVDIIVDFAMS